MRCFIGLGSNLGNRRENLEGAARSLAALSADGKIKLSAIYENTALVPDGAPLEWRQPYLNAVAEINCSASPHELLLRLKDIEKVLGRQLAERWSPRLIDLDILVFGEECTNTEPLRIPHPGIGSRSFVLDPLKDLDATLRIPGTSETVLSLSRKQPQHQPWIMAIMNLTPDSFSDGGELLSAENIEARFHTLEQSGVHAIDVGAESTRPGATAVSLEEEEQRLRPLFSFLRRQNTETHFRPVLSIDTRRPEIAKMALDCGFDYINDVSGLTDPRMLEILLETSCHYILTHSLTVPADRDVRLPTDTDPVQHLKEWLYKKLEWMDAKGVDLKRIVFDPGIGFGKSPRQSWDILKRLEEFQDAPVRLLIGHSRKGFLRTLGIEDRQGLDASTLFTSLAIAPYVDILRVHDFTSHLSAFRTKMEFEQ